MRSRSTLLLLSFFSFVNLHAQTGRLKLYLERSEYDVRLGSYSWQLRDNDSVAYTGKFLENEDEAARDSVRLGEYTLVILVNETPNVTYPKIKISDNSETSVSVRVIEPTIEPISDDTLYSSNFVVSFYAQYGPKLAAPLDPYPLADMWQVGFTEGSFFNLGKHFAPGFFVGSDFGISRFEKGKGPDSISHNWEHYAFWSFDPTVLFRLGLYNMETEEDAGPFLDLGASYNFPIIFRHTTFDGTSRTMDRGIHQFKDLRAVVRLGYGPVSLQGEYRLTDFILGDYPEMPKLRIGLAIMFNEPD
jgi:hypothetical protein